MHNTSCGRTQGFKQENVNYVTIESICWTFLDLLEVEFKSNLEVNVYQTHTLAIKS